MSTIQNLLEQAQLAEAAYANLTDPQTNLPYADATKIQGALEAGKFSSKSKGSPISRPASSE